MRAVLLAMALPGVCVAAERLDCEIVQKCGASGMCVETREAMAVERGEGMLSVAGLPGLRDPAAFELGPDDTFVFRPPKAAFAAAGTSFDHMAVQFAGHCTRLGGQP